MRPVLALVLLAACSEDQPTIRSLVPAIAVSPESLPMGDVIVTQSGTEAIYITNAGRADLDVTLSYAGDDVFTFDLGSEPFTIEPDASATVVATFTPDNFLEYSGTLTISSNDEENPVKTVELTGKGVDAPMPDIDVPRLALDFGEVAQGSLAFESFVVANVGEELLLWEIEQEGSPAFTVQGSLVNQATNADGETTIFVVYEPLVADVGDNGTLTLKSNDPDEPEVVVTLVGNGGGDFEYPVADLICPEEVYITGPQYVRVDGSASYDPAGNEPLTYTWSTVAPEGSATQLAYALSDRTTVDVPLDVAGDYTVSLTVHNAIGLPSLPASCTMNVIPEDEIRVELSWDTPAADLDLHLLQNDTAELFDTPEDACFCNESPDWGGSGADDDPRLDIDDRGGFGPENINILTPADGTYPVKVHYYAEQGDDIVVARVVVWSEGNKLWEGSKSMEQNEVWEVGQVNWPEATFADSDTPLYDAPRKSCR